MGTRTSPGHITKKAGVRVWAEAPTRSVSFYLERNAGEQAPRRDRTRVPLDEHCLGPGSENTDQVLGTAKEKVRVESAPRTLCPEPEMNPTCPAAGPRRLPHGEGRLGPELAKLGR